MFQVTAWLLAGCGTLLNAQPQPTPAAGNGTVGVTAVCSRVSKDYVRTKLPDGSFQPEEYVLVKGVSPSGPFRDASIDDAKFIGIARALEGPLAVQNYIPAKKLDTEKLIIMVYWGTTIVPQTLDMSPAWGRLGNEIPARMDFNKLQTWRSELGPEIAMRNQMDKKNARMLGYDSEVSFGVVGHTGITADAHNDELLSELEDNRYFVVLIAFDFQAFRTEKKHKIIWETRFSIQEGRNFFDKALPVMVQYASRYFGQDSHGLLRTKVPEGKVLIGELKSLGVVKVPEK